MIKRIARASVLAAALTALTASAALAHECFISNRSSNGNQAAGTHSRSWFYVDLPTLAAFLSDPSSPDALPPLSPSQLEYFIERAQQLGVPADLALFVGGRPKTGGFTIAGDAAGFIANDKAADGKGLDHFFTAHFGSVVTAYLEALDQPAS